MTLERFLQDLDRDIRKAADWGKVADYIPELAGVAPDQFGGRGLVYLPCYVASDDPIFEESDQAIEARFLKAFRSMYPALTDDDIEAFRISRVRYVLPVSTLNYSDRLPPMATSVPGLTVANSAHIVNGTLNVNETLELAHKVADYLLDSNAIDDRNAACMGDLVA